MKIKGDLVIMPNKKKKRNWLHLFFFIALLVLIGWSGFFLSKAYSRESNVQARIHRDEVLKKGSVLSIDFDSGMLKESVQSGIAVEPQLQMEGWWKDDRTFHLELKQSPRPDTQYKLKIIGAKSRWLLPQKEYEFDFSGSRSPNLAEISPQNNQTEVDYYGAIKMKFDQSLADQYRVEVTIDPQTGFSHILDQTLKELTIVPDEKMKEDSQYGIKAELYSKDYLDFKKIIYEGSFHTKKPPEVTYALDQDGQATKTEKKKEQVTPQITEGKYIDIDLSSQTLHLFEDGREKGAFKISSGKSGMNTPEGTFKVMGKSKRPWSKKYSLYMPWFIQFTNLGHGIHELPEWPGGYKEGANHLGTPVSHGCVRLGVGPAKIVYDFADKDLPIVIHQ